MLYPDPYDNEWAKDPYKASPESCFDRYYVKVDHDYGDRASEIKFCSLKRPHMRALHCAYISFFLAFLIWFAIAPLLAEIQKDLNLTTEQIWSSTIAGDVTTIFLRMIIGPICDKHGARIPMAVVLCVAAIPTALTGLVNSAAGLIALRFFIGIAGSSFVMAQFWPTRMFTREIAGTANGMVGGWGNMGGAFAQLLMGSILFPAFTNVFNGDSEKSWRFICVIPAVAALIWGLIVAFVSDDAPMGNYSEMRKKGSMDQIYFTTSLRSGASKNTWILYIQYACCFGVELVMNNAGVLYFTSEFGLSTEKAAAISSIFGWMNLFARLLGGYGSDKLNLKMGMRARLWLQTILLLLEGFTIIIFSFTKTLGGAIFAMAVFSVFVNAAEGAIFGVVPYVSKLYAGSVSGFVGSGGNVGSVVFSFGFWSLPYRDAFLMMGSIVMASSLTSFFFKIPCHAGLISGQDNNEVILARERHLRRRQIEAERDEEPSQQTALQTQAEAAELTHDEGAAALDVEDPLFAEDTHATASKSDAFPDGEVPPAEQIVIDSRADN
jgi:NNP family nitrate/nitrite transporter-like MFS transporter